MTFHKIIDKITDSLKFKAGDTVKRKKGAYRFFKRLLDIILAFFAIIILSPFLLIMSLLVLIDSGSPVIFKQNRVGMDGKLFLIYKFRTMRTDAPSVTATKDLEDPYRYITRIGRFLRKTSLDELPQLFNVIKGDMSLIGPRPLIENEGEIHVLRHEAGVYSVRPGLTGWAQVNGRDNVPDEEKVAYDKEYSDKFSFGFDLKIIFKTIAVVFKRDGYAEGKQDEDK